ncbi:MAG TPA: type VI secretion IcmF C-terminal domain-containing protein, partial [Gammaproteobacteria bacterium]|nr:type VI secretion IcmF C-terminal domain-containing protein [Gammaproteobacteria bacterium]
ALTRADGDNPPPAGALIAALGGVRDYLLNITGNTNSDKAAYQAAAQRMGGGSGDAIGKLQRMAADLPDPVAGWMKIVAGHVWGGVLGGARSYINQQWRAIVVQPYRDSLQGRYPLSRNASQQATLADFGHFFGPGGILPGFVKDYLQPFVDTRTWRLDSAGHRSLGLSASDLHMLRRGAEIGKLFFHNGGQQPAITFSLKPIDLSAHASRFVLEVAGQSVDYRHGPRRRSTMQWPGPDGQGARIVFQQINGGDLTVTKEGPWAWFQLLDTARIEGGGSADVLRVTFTKGKLKARYQLRASSVDNPFHDNILQQFRLPDSL